MRLGKVKERRCSNLKCQRLFSYRNPKNTLCSVQCRGQVYDQRHYAKRQAGHRATLTRLPWIRHWSNLKTRCRNPNRLTWKSYGGRGIEVRITLGEVKALYLRDNARLMKQPSIDRINPNGHYEYANCRFIEWNQNRPRSMKGRTLNLNPAERERRSQWMTHNGRRIKKQR